MQNRRHETNRYLSICECTITLHTTSEDITPHITNKTHKRNVQYYNPITLETKTLAVANTHHSLSCQKTKNCSVDRGRAPQGEAASLSQWDRHQPTPSHWSGKYKNRRRGREENIKHTLGPQNHNLRFDGFHILFRTRHIRKSRVGSLVHVLSCYQNLVQKCYQIFPINW